MHSLQRLNYIVVIVCTLFSSLSYASAGAPNILMIVADDLGYGDSQAWYAASDKQTPTLNKLAQDGVKFTRFYTDSTCSTSRAALLTGQHPTRLGFHPVARGIPSELMTLPEYLQQGNYSTALIGKWHVGELYSQAFPNAQGFEYFFGYLNQWLLQGPEPDGTVKLKAPVYYDPWLQENDNPAQPLMGYLPELLTAKAESWIEAQTQQRPWFLMYATPLPHGPLVAPPELAQTSDKPADTQAVYRAMVSHFDSDLARLLTALERSGQRDNTLIVILSDNGAPAKLSGSNAGFGGGKWSYSEGGVRVPMLWLWPKNFPPPAELNPNQIVFIADIYPTLKHYLGAFTKQVAVPQPFDGRNAFIDPVPEVFNWMTRNSYSRLEGDQRYSGNWMFRTWLDRNQETISAAAAQSREVAAREVKEIEQRFSRWLDSITQTQLTGKDQVYRGNDFLRTPLKEWDFYLAVKAEVAAEQTASAQWLAGQSGSWQLTWDGRQLDLQLHGGRWQVRLPADGQCRVIGINADLYDRFTNLGENINLSRVTMTIDAIERLDGKWQIEDLSGVDIEQPLIVARSPDKNYRNWQGKVGEPLLFHRANRAGDWAFLLDEKAIKQQLCASLAAQK